MSAYRGADVNGSQQDGTYRAEFLAVLDEALHSEEIRRALRRAAGPAEPGGTSIESLRARALQAADTIGTAAADEYARYTALRDAASVGARARRTRTGSDADGPGVTATLAVLVPLLSGVAAVTFLALGFGLRAAGSGHRVTASLTGVGFTTAGVFGVALLVGLAGLVLTARRDAAAARATLDLATARQEWRRALLTEGVLPYLRACVGPPAGVSLVRKKPRLGYSSPGFGSSSSSSGGVSLIRQRPKLGYTSPGFSSPADPPPS